LSAALVCVLPAASGCGSEDAEDPPGKKSALCAVDACERGEPCGCEGMHPSCDCELCQLAGECQPTADGFGCAPVTAEDCNHPNGACERYGHCVVVEGEFGTMCVPGSEDDCRASTLCREHGACGLIAEVPTQCFVVSDEDCAASVACEDAGCCTLIDADCSKSDGSCSTKCCGDELC
jgi:hypothetical protein